jgi:hypothetical protein
VIIRLSGVDAYWARRGSGRPRPGTRLPDRSVTLVEAFAMRHAGLGQCYELINFARQHLDDVSGLPIDAALERLAEAFDAQR